MFDREIGTCAPANLRISQATSLMVMAVPCGIALWVDALASFVFLLMACLNARCWSALYSEMHQPSTSGFPGTGCISISSDGTTGTIGIRENFNTLFLMWDWILGTSANMTE